jgi:hypothetical protein
MGARDSQEDMAGVGKYLEPLFYLGQRQTSSSIRDSNFHDFE